MARLLRMPEVAANAVEAVLAEWPVAENASFLEQDAIVTIETEKAVVDVPADADGVMLRHLVQSGASVAVGDPIALLGDTGETPDDIDTLLRELGVGPRGAAPTTAGPDPLVVSVGAPAPVPAAPVPSIPTAAPPPASKPAPVPSAPAAAVPPPSSEPVSGRIFSSPLARRLATAAELSLPELVGTGPGGRIVRRDVEQAISAKRTNGHSEPVGDVGSGAYQDIPHSRMRRAIATRLSESKREAPHFYLSGTAKVDRLLRLRAELNGSAGPKVSVNDLVVLAAARAHAAAPAMNVTWTEEATRQWSGVDIAVAVASERGLVTPVVRGVDRMTLSALASATQDLVARARSGRLREDELAGGTLTVTNLGPYGTESFSAILNPPQAAILAVGAAREEPLVRKGKLKVGTVMHLTLSVDHRVVDGAVAAQWMAAFVELLEHPVRVLA